MLIKLIDALTQPKRGAFTLELEAMEAEIDAKQKAIESLANKHRGEVEKIIGKNYAVGVSEFIAKSITDERVSLDVFKTQEGYEISIKVKS